MAAGALRSARRDPDVMINVIPSGALAVQAPFSECSLLRVQQVEANGRCRLAVWADKPNPPIGYAVLRAEKFMD